MVLLRTAVPTLFILWAGWAVTGPSGGWIQLLGSIWHMVGVQSSCGAEGRRVHNLTLIQPCRVQEGAAQPNLDRCRVGLILASNGLGGTGYIHVELPSFSCHWISQPMGFPVGQMPGLVCGLGVEPPWPGTSHRLAKKWCALENTFKNLFPTDYEPHLWKFTTQWYPHWWTKLTSYLTTLVEW